MALSDYIERLANIAGEGTRATDFTVMRSQRNQAKKAFLDDLALQKQRNLQFTAFAPPSQQQGNDQGGPPVAGNFGGKLEAYPLHGKLRVTSPFGVNRKGHKSAHTGIDWGAPAGTPIYAPGSGSISATNHDKIYGNQTILDLGGGYKVMFGHQSGFNVKPGQQVHAGQIIGYVGSTGWSTGPHLHFETWYNNKPVNPLSWFQ